MKFLHTSDWHVGRTLNGWSLLEEQAWAFQQIVDLAISEKSGWGYHCGRPL